MEMGYQIDHKVNLQLNTIGTSYTGISSNITSSRYGNLQLETSRQRRSIVLSPTHSI